MTKTNNPLFSNSYHVVYDRVQKKCNINQKEFFSGKFFVDKQSSGFYSYDQPEGARITPLQYACLQNNQDIALLLTQKAANVNAIDTNGVSVLQMAVMNDLLSVVKALVDGGADVNYRSKLGSVLDICCMAHAADSAAYLMDHGAEISGQSLKVACRYYNKKILERMLQAEGEQVNNLLFWCCSSLNNVNPVKYLLNRGGKLSYKKDGRNLLHATCTQQGKTTNIMKFLFDNGLCIDSADREGNTPLHLASIHHNYQAIEWLLKNGANPELENNVGEQPILYAAANGAYTKRLVTVFRKYTDIDLFTQDLIGRSLKDYLSQKQMAEIS